jgi:hypothetical protein
MTKKNSILLLGLMVILLMLVGGIYFYKKFIPTSENQENKVITHSPCLKDNEIVDYKIERNNDGGGLATIYIKDKKSNDEIFNFQFAISDPDHYHPIELHKCGVYAIRTFGYDYQNKKLLENYKRELWVYKYNGEGNSLITSYAKWSYEDILSDFRIDPQERYIALLKGYLGSPDYALIIKDLNILKDVFTLPMAEIEKQKPKIVQDIELDGWTRDSRYFWANTHYGANTLGFIRIDTTDWSVKLLPAPKDVLGGDALNLENGFITVHPGNVWYGIAEITEQEKAKRRAQGIGTELYIQNLFTNKSLFVASTTEPLWYFKSQWISDTELQYEMPNGEKKIYKTTP